MLMDNSRIHLRRERKRESGKKRRERRGKTGQKRTEEREMDLSANEACVKFNSQ